jgi:hypothetical protein
VPELTEVPGIDEILVGRLHNMGIHSAQAFLDEASTRAGRLRIGVQSGIGKKQVQAVVEALIAML